MRKLLLFLLSLLVIGCSAPPGGDAFAVSSFEKLSEKWDAGDMKALADPEYFKAMTEEQHRQFFALLAQQLGPRVSSQPPAWTRTHRSDGKVFQVYTIDFECKKGKGTATLTLSHDGSAWRLRGLHINSDAILAKVTPTPSATP